MKDEDRRQGRVATGADLIIPVAASFYAVYYVYSVWDFPPEAQRSGIFMASLLLLLSACFFVRTLVRLLRGRAVWGWGELAGPSEGRWNRLVFFALILAYLVIVPWGGFTLTTFAFLLAGSYVSGLRPLRRAILFAGCGAIGGWLFFIVILRTRFPRGPFEDLVAWMVQAWT